MLLTLRRRAGLAAVLAAAGLVVVGCGSEPQPSDDYLEPGMRADVLARVQALNYPFEADPTYAVRIADLQTRLINACVERQGVVPPRVAPTPLTTELVVPDESRLWLLPGADYGVATALSSPEVLASLAAEDPADPAADAAPPDPVAYDAAVYGPQDERIDFPIEGGGSASVPIGGCFGEATEAMYGVPAAEYERAYYAIPNVREVLTTLRSDGSVRAAARRWSSCMSEAGVQADDPGGLYPVMSRWVDDVVAGRRLVSHIQQQEQHLAQEDQECRTSSGLGTALSTTFLELADSALEGSEGVVLEHRAMVEHAQALIAAP